MGGEPLGLLFAKNFGVASILSGNLSGVISFFWGVYHNPTYEISVVPNGPRSINTLGKELCSFCVWASEYDGKMSVVDPPTFPIYLWLRRGKPWVAKNGLMLAEVGEEEL